MKAIQEELEACQEETEAKMNASLGAAETCL
jgi:hypothetical protein